MTPQQLRSARGILDWSRAKLGSRAGVSPETIKNIETATFKPQPGTLHAIIKTFKEEGVVFLELPYGTVGVVWKDKSASTVQDEAVSASASSLGGQQG